MCCRNTVREREREREREFTHISLLWQKPFLWSSAAAGEYTRRADRSAWVTSGSLPSLEKPTDPSDWATTGSLPSIQNYRTYNVFSSPMRKYEHLLCLTYFSVYGWLSVLTYFRFFLVICWSYLPKKISVTLTKGNKLYFRHHLLYFSFLWKHFDDVILRPPWIC